MTMPAWPAGLSHEIFAGTWSMKPWLAPIATEMDGGNQRTRRRPGDNVAVIAFRLGALSATDFATLMAFFREDLSNGTARFTMPVWTGTDYETKTVQFEGGEPPAPEMFAVDHLAVAMRLRVYGM